MNLRIEIAREEDGRWIAEVADLPGVMTYGTTRGDAVAKAKALALRVIADRLEHGEEVPESAEMFAVPHEFMAFIQSPKSLGGAAPHRLERQAHQRFASHPATRGLA